MLPIIRNTVTGILGVDRNVREAAVAMGMTDKQILQQVEMPTRDECDSYGVRVAMVIAVGVTTIAAAVGAGGLGVFIFRGLRQYDNNLLLAGALPAALMALAADFSLGLLEKRFSVEGKIKKHRSLGFTIGIAALVVFVLLAGLGIWSALRGRSPDESGSRGRCRSKDFTESVLLAEIMAQSLEARGVTVERQFELGGNLPHDALVAGKIDLYPEYTGTAYTAILRHPPITDPRAVYEQVKREYRERFKLR